MNEALFTIDSQGGLLNSSTYTPGTFQLTNSSNSAEITSITLDLTTAIFPDLVFDPDGTAGDSTAKGFTFDNQSDTTVKVSSHSFSPVRDGGHDILKIDFASFKPGEILKFSVDVDPTSIKGSEDPGPNQSGSVSGLELVGATVTVKYADGEELTGQVYRLPNSDSGSQVTLAANNVGVPTIEVVDVDGSATVAEATQTIRVNGTPGAEVSLLIVEGAFYTEADGGFDPDALEANTAIAIDEITKTIGAEGTVDIPVTLSRTNESGGLNHFVAKYKNGNQLSSKLVLEFEPTSGGSNSGAPTATLIAPELADPSQPYSFSITYTDDVAVDATSIDSNDVIVTAPDGTVLPATLVNTEDTNGDGTLVTATYSVAAPDGTWQESDRGGYRVAIATGEVTDTSSNAVAAQVLGNFAINFVHNPSATGVIRIEAEDYKAGTNGVEYFDENVENVSNAYRLNEEVDIEPTGDEGGGFNLSFTKPGEFLTYDVNILEAGNYELVLRVANRDAFNKTIDVVIGGETYPATIVSTGGFQKYTDVVVPNVSLDAGVQELRLNIKSENININYIELEAKEPVIDETAPIAQLDTTALTQQFQSVGAATFTVTFTDDISVDNATIDSDDVTVTAPDGTIFPVTLVKVDNPDNGTPLTATYSIAAPGGKWDAADEGEYTVKIKEAQVSDTSNNAIAASTLGKITIDVTEDPSTLNTDIIRIEAEDYKAGNNGIEYFDTSRRNFGGGHRQGDVDIEATGDTNGGHNVAWIEAGEYLTYDVDLTTAGRYNLVLRVATPAEDTKQVDVTIDGQTYTASFSNTGGWQTYQDVAIENVNLNAGTKELRLDMKSGSFNLNYVDLVVDQPAIDAIRIEAEDYKAGTNGVEYFDTDAENITKAYRPNEAVDIEETGDEGGGFNVSYTKPGEYLTYDVDIPADGDYELVLRVANRDTFDKTIDVVIGGETYPATIVSTGGFQKYADVVVPNVSLNAGMQELRLNIKSENVNINYIEIAPAEPIIDETAPAVKLENTPDDSDTVVSNQLPGSLATAKFSLTFSDNLGVDFATIGKDDVTIAAPDGTTVPVTLVGINNDSNGTPLTATYSIAAPGGSWDSADAGEYTLKLSQDAVSDTSGNTTAARTLGKLDLNVSDPASDNAIRINAGADVDTLDTAGKLWLADQNFTGGKFIDPVYNPIDNTKDDFIYQSQRSGSNFSYNIPVDNGNYNVSLYLSELNFTDTGSRLFDVSLEGDLALDNLDIHKLTNNAFLDGENDASIVEIPDLAIIRDGAINLDFASVVQDATLAGIKITPVEGAQVLIEESQQNTSVTEDGDTDTYQVLLNTKPTANVKIDLKLDNQVSVDKDSLVFTPDNWNVPQTVTITAVDDEAGESFHSSTIGHTISTTDAVYANLTVPSVSASIIDNDLTEIKFKPKITVDSEEKNLKNINPTVAAWGPDGRLYVSFVQFSKQGTGPNNGLIKAYTFDDDYKVIEVEDIDAIAGLSNSSITGIAFNPFENDGSQPKIYVSHNQFYANADSYAKEGGFNELTDFSPYSGQVSILEGPDFSLTPLVENIGVSNHDHGVNGLAFDGNGDLLIAVGSNTNAGIADDAIGGIDESPFTAAILKAEITKPDFNGNIQYVLPEDWVAPEGLELENPEQSQGFGGIVDVAPGVDVSVYASGLRNPYDLVYATNGKIYATENGANNGFGDVSLDADTQEPFNPNLNIADELNIIEDGAYYGQPNRNRGQDDPRQNTYYYYNESSNEEYTAPIEKFQSSTNGIIEYRSTAFGGQLRGNLLAQKWNGQLYNVELSADGTEVLNKNTLKTELANGDTENLASGLDVLTGPGGAIVSIDYNTPKAIYVSVPDDDLLTNAIAYDISDWRAPATGGGQFTIGGINFSGSTTDTTVTIGDKPATVTEVTEKRIIGTFPSFEPTDSIFGTTDYTEDNLLDITVTSGNEVSVIPDAFQPLFV